MTTVNRSVRLLVAVLAATALIVGFAAAPAQAAARPVSISLSAPATITSGGGVTLHGVARYATSKKPVKKNKVRIQRKSGKHWITVATVKTSKKGKYSYRVRSQAASHSYRAVLLKSRSHGTKVSKTKKVTARQGITVTSKGGSTIVAGSTVAVSGVVTPGLAGKPVTLQRAQSGQWLDVKTVTAGKNRTFSISAPIYGAGKARQLRVVGKNAASGAWSLDVYGWFYLSDSFQSDSSDNYLNYNTRYWVDPGTLTVRGVVYSKSIYVGRPYDPWVEYTLAGGGCTRFRASVGIDDGGTTGATGRFQMFNDGVEAHGAITKTVGESPTSIDVAVNGVFRIKLETLDVDGYQAARGWLDPQILCFSQPNPAS